MMMQCVHRLPPPKHHPTITTTTRAHVPNTATGLQRAADRRPAPRLARAHLGGGRLLRPRSRLPGAGQGRLPPGGLLGRVLRLPRALPRQGVGLRPRVSCGSGWRGAHIHTHISRWNPFNPIHHPPAFPFQDLLHGRALFRPSGSGLRRLQGHPAQLPRAPVLPPARDPDHRVGPDEHEPRPPARQDQVAGHRGAAPPALHLRLPLLERWV